MRAQWHERMFWDERYVLYYDCDGGYITVYILRHQIFHLKLINVNVYTLMKNNEIKSKNIQYKHNICEYVS